MTTPGWAEGGVDKFIDEANAAFEQDCVDRHEMGEEKYGSNTFVGKDTFRMAMDELVDLSNYLRYSYIQLYLMRNYFKENLGGIAHPIPGREKMGKEAIFQPFKRRD